MPSVSPTSFVPSLPADPMAHLHKPGETRCFRAPPDHYDSVAAETLTDNPGITDWSLLSSDLSFIYLDPVLASHLEDQAPLLIGKSLLHFVHPDEQESARNDLTDALERKTMHGSVTRVRYCRLSRVRRMLGYADQSPSWSDAAKAASDEYYMAVDIVISWAAEGLVLCFIHAVCDVDLVNSDVHQKTSWSTWCGTPSLSHPQVQVLYERLQYYCPQPGVLSKVFQILTNSSHQDYRLLLSWPPDTSHEYSNKPSAKDFARRAENVLPATHDSSAKTSCTKRWRIGGTMPAINGEVESVFIPHGTIMFACHTIQSSPRNSGGTPSHAQYATRTHEGHVPHPAHHPYDISANSYTLPPVSTSAPAYSHLSGSLPPPYSSQHWTGHPESSSLLNYNRWTTNGSSTHAMTPLSAPCPVRETSYGVPPSGRPADSAGFTELRGPQHSYQTTSPNVEYIDRRGADIPALSSSAPDVVPPPRHRVSPGAGREIVGRAGNRPVGILRCTSCKVTSSPEWRKGPSGKKELCNACGLRYARSRAKKEGHVAGGPRRKKEKATSMGVKEESIRTQSSPIAIAGAATGSNAFESGSVGSASGSEPYSQHSPVATEPSPSPPTANINFVHYSHPPPAPPRTVQSRNDRRASFNPSAPFQPTPSPLASQTAHRNYRGHEDSTALPSRMGPYNPYVNSAASANASPAGSLPPLPSFERDRGDDRYMPAPQEVKYDRYSVGMQR
ncbi:hypothetical protein ID866_6331 [Astraeus odoratus]|nr:hypothetical protein ID866_6331 [Astraeus odoratus]